MTPIEMLDSARPGFLERRTAPPPSRLFDVRWNRDAGDPEPLPTYVHRELSRHPGQATYAGWYESPWEGRFTVVVRAGALPLLDPSWLTDAGTAPSAIAAFERIIDEGESAEGPARWSYFVHGADLAALARAGFRLTWDAAQCLYAAVCATLSPLHAAGWLHGGLSAARIRLALEPEPYVEDSGPAPIRLCGYQGVRVTPQGPATAAQELRVVAAAVGALAGVPDVPVDALSGEGSVGPGVAQELTGLWRQVARMCGEPDGHEHREER